MEVKPGYKQTEVGVIPEEWEVRSIGRMFRLVNGCAFKPADWKGNGTPIIRIQNLNDPSAPFNYSQAPVAERNRIEAGDLLFAWSGTIGTSFGARVWSGPSGVLNQHIFKVHMDQQQITLPFSLLVFGRIEEDIAKQAHGFKASFVHVKKSDLVKVSLPLPPVSEQRAIAEALSDVNGLLGGLDRLIAKKRDLKQAAMQQLLTGQTRLPGFHGEWRMMKLGELCDYVDGIPTTGGDLGYLEIGDVNVETKSYDVAQKEKLSVRGAVKVPAGTLLISTVRPTRGAIVITKSTLHVSSAFCRVCPVNGLLLHLVCQPKFLAYLGENSIGGTYPTCRDETILGYESMVPSDPAEQTAITEVLTAMDLELAALGERREKTCALKQAMMQELLTGNTRLV